MSRGEIALEYTLNPAEVDALLTVTDRLAMAPVGPAEPAFYDRNWDIYQLLPSGLRMFLENFRRTEPAAACLIHGFPVDDEAVGPTPAHWKQATETRSARGQEIFIAMCGMTVGEPFTWSTLQLGQMVQNILPIRGDERRQSGHSSQTLLEFHTEDGFHPNRCDYLILFGIRNHDRIPTFIASIRDVKLTDKELQILSEPRFHILPDDEHLRQLEMMNPDHPALARAMEMKEDPLAVAVIFGDPARPYLRIDRPFMRCVGADTAAEEALESLMCELGRVRQSIAIKKGTLMILDNYLAVHGRKAFDVKYDGTDRWLKRMIVSRNLRDAAADSMSDTGRVLF